jgi:very-short-patch-repair endonuclease
VVHRSTRAHLARHPTQLPARTRVEDTVLDLAHRSATFDAALNWACAACQRRLTTTERLQAAIGARNKLRWRGELADALGDVGAGVHSVLEYRYVRQVERPHGLPRAVRQAKISRGNRNWYLDNLYAEYSLCVELDGRGAHSFDRRWLDIRRDNAAAAEGLLTLRYSWTDVTVRSCATAAQVAAVLMQRGWSGGVRRCGPECAVR